MQEITITQLEGELVVDSRIVAEQLGVEHESLMRLIKKHQPKLEAKFGVLRFEIEKPPEGSQGGRPESFAWLNEYQSTAILTLSRNTDRVVDFKFELVEKFQDQKRQLEDPVDRAMLDELAQRAAQIDPPKLTDKQVGEVFGMAFAPDPKMLHGIRYILAHDNLTATQRDILEDLL